MAEERLQFQNCFFGCRVENARDLRGIGIGEAPGERGHHGLHEKQVQILFAGGDFLPRLQNNAQGLRRQDARRVAKIAACKRVPGFLLGDPRLGKTRKALKCADGFLGRLAVNSVGIDV